MTDVSFVKLPSDECKWILLMISRHWFRQWLGDVRQQAIIWGNVDPDPCRHMVSIGHNELNAGSIRTCIFMVITTPTNVPAPNNQPSTANADKHIEAETKLSPFHRRHFQMHFLNENAQISLKISLKFLPKVQINNILALCQIMAWSQPGDKSLSEPMVVQSILTSHQSTLEKQTSVQF